MMLRFTRAILAAAALGLGLAALGPDAQARTVLKIGTLAPEGTPWHDALRSLGDEWEKISGGEVSVRIYPGGVAGDEPDMVRKMRIGQLHAATLTAIGMGQIADDIKVLQTPFLFRDDAELLCTRAKVRGDLEKGLTAQGFVLLTWADAGWVRFFAKEPIVKPDDLKGRKMFFWSGDDTLIAGWRDWGVEPVPMALTDLFVGLQSGLVDTISTTPLAALSYQWFPLAPNMTDLRLAPLVGGVVVTNKAWAKVPENFHQPFIEAAERHSADLTKASAKYEQDAVDAMKEHGLKVVPVTQDDILLWEETARRDLYPLIARQISPEINRTVTAARDSCRGG